MTWVRSSTCNGASACIEIEERGGILYIRNSGNLGSPLIATPGEVAAFLAGAKRGDFDEVVQRAERSPTMGDVPEAAKTLAPTRGE